MPQIAQQDYLHIVVESVSELTDAEKANIAAKVKAGTIFDCIICLAESGALYRPIFVDSDTKMVVIADNGGVIELDYGE